MFKLKKELLKLLILGIVCFIVVGCGQKKKDGLREERKHEDIARGKEENNTVDFQYKTIEYQNFIIKQSDNPNADFFIPDPSTCGSEAEVVLPDVENWADFENEPVFKLDFLGLKEDFHVKKYEVGNVSGTGEDLVLELEPTNIDSENEYDEYIKLAVLNFETHSSFVVDIDGMYSGHDKMILRDITGDDKSEVFLATTPNTYVDWAVVRFEKDRLKLIHNTADDMKIMEFRNYDIIVQDEYKVKIWSKFTEFKKRISLLDLGYKKGELEYYDSGHLICDEDEIFTRIWPLSENNLQIDKISEKNGIQYYFPVTVEISPSNAVDIGRFEITLKYDESSDKLYIDKEIFKEITKEENLKQYVK
ncbi:MAG: hypothetical protein K6G65_02450 [Lachnospiraceae bacterium]|nr:hypothetical protein [Lachnospiraceae bacterium]